MTTRTFGDFLLSAANSEVPLWAAEFKASENARLALARAMGTEHEMAHCLQYTETIFFRVFSCWFDAMWRELAKDWIGGSDTDSPRKLNGYDAATHAARNSAVAVSRFGTNLSIARETAIRDWLVENRGGIPSPYPNSIRRACRNT